MLQPVIAIDFETANENHASPCEIGLAWIEDGSVTRTYSRLIRPLGNRFSGMNISIHGIEPEDVENEPEFPEIWAEVAPMLDGALLLAHFAPFDMSVLRKTLDLYDLPPCSADILCTCSASRVAWPDLDGHGLAVVADHLGLTFDHHRAGPDAVAAARIALSAAEALGAPTIHDIGRVAGLRIGHLSPDGYTSCRSTKKVATINGLYANPDARGPLAGRRIVFTGALSRMRRMDAARLAAAAGAECQDGVKRDTDILVVGLIEHSGKMKKAREYAERFGRLNIIGEEEFFFLLSGGADDLD